MKAILLVLDSRLVDTIVEVLNLGVTWQKHQYGAFLPPFPSHTILEIIFQAEVL